MGVSTDAILFYGYIWDEEIDLFASCRHDGDSDTREWPEIVLVKRGERDPWDDYPANEAIRSLPYFERRATEQKWVDDNRAIIADWRTKRDAVRAEFGVDVGNHCSGDCSMPYLYVHRFVASRGNPLAIDLPPIDPAWQEQLDRFLTEFSIPKPQESPRWWLVSYWG